MSLSSITYANRQNIDLGYDRIVGGLMTYKENAYDRMWVFSHGWTKAINCVRPYGDTNWYTDELMQLNNGLKLCFMYQFTAQDVDFLNCTLKCKYVLKNPGGTVVKDYGEYTYNMQKGIASYTPFSNVTVSAVATVYGENTTVTGERAKELYFPGPIFIEKTDHITTSQPLTGYVLQEDIGRDWIISQIGRSASSDNDLAALKSEVIQGGDGKDPFTTESPADEPDPSTPGGGDSPSTDGGEAVDFPGLPTTSVINTGLITLYKPTNQQLQSLAGVLWGNDFENSIKKILNDPFDGIIGLSLLPFTPHTGGNANCKIGNFNTEVEMPLIDQQYITLDCGSLSIKESWKNALDYSPNTIIDIFLPFCGFKPLKTEDVMKSTISVKYNVDVLSGSAVAIVKCGDKVMYNYPCKLSYDVPLTGSNKAALYTGLINVALSTIGGAAAGGALGAAGGAATSAIQTATSKQSSVERSGAVTSNTGILGDFTPYILIHRPVQSMPRDFKMIKGYQSNITEYLGNLSGYTEVDFIHLENISGATDAELREIENLLKEGVII